jgi:hypothetical protein
MPYEDNFLSGCPLDLLEDPDHFLDVLVLFPDAQNFPLQNPVLHPHFQDCDIKYFTWGENLVIEVKRQVSDLYTVRFQVIMYPHDENALHNDQNVLTEVVVQRTSQNVITQQKEIECPYEEVIDIMTNLFEDIDNDIQEIVQNIKNECESALSEEEKLTYKFKPLEEEKRLSDRNALQKLTTFCKKLSEDSY